MIMTFEEAVKEYLSEKSDSGNPKNEVAIGCLRWMARKVPSGLRNPETGKVQRYTKKSALKHPEFKVLFDPTSGRFAGRQMASISRRDVTNLRKSLLNDKGLSNDGANNYLKYLRAAIHYAEEELEIEFDNKPKIKALKGKKRQRYFSPAEARAFMKYLDPLRADMVEIALHIGQRNANIRLMRWDWLDKRHEVLSIPASETKTGEPLECYLNADARKVISRRWELCCEMAAKHPLQCKLDYVFTQSTPQHLGKPMAKGSMCRGRWKTALAQAGLPPELVFHSCRHTFASWLLSEGTLPKELMDVGGWKSVASMDGYMHLVVGRKQEVSARIEGRLLR
tara:strand:- start:270 stop:1283 length:1014 start_codon:yes stop_codon:yes gene_type:complete